MSRFFQYLVYLAVRCVEGVVWITPISVCFIGGKVVGTLAYFFLGSYRRLVIGNLEIGFGDELDAGEIRKRARRHFSLVGANVISGIKVGMMKLEAVRERVEFEGLERAREVCDRGEGLIYLIPHMGNWEILTQVPEVVVGRTPSTLYQPIRNPYLDKLVRMRRARVNYVLFDRTEGFHGPVQHLRDGGVVGILVDQHAGDAGVWCPMFGRLASTTTLAALCSMRTGAAMLTLCVKTVGVARWRLEIGDPVESSDGSKPSAGALAARMNVALEEGIRRSPEDWFWVHDRWKTPDPKFLLRKYKRGIVLPEGMEFGDLQRFRILVRSPNWLGDACMTLPAVRAIKRGRPDAEVTILCPDKLAEFWRAIPEVDAILERKGKASIFAVQRMIRNSGVRYDAAIILPNSPRTVLEVCWTGIGRIVGYRGRWRARFMDQIVTSKVKPGPPRHQVYHYLELADRIGADIKEAGLLDPERPEREEDGTVRIGVCAGAEYGPAKRWPLERFAEVANRVGKVRSEAKFFLFGVPKEAALAEELAGLLEVPHENLVGKTTMAEFIGVLQNCHLVVTNDTGTMHLAAALGVPTVSIFGSTEPTLTGPVGDGHTVIRHQVECSPCFLRECPLDFRCMKAVGAEEVKSAVLEMIGGTD